MKIKITTKNKKEKLLGRMKTRNSDKKNNNNNNKIAVKTENEDINIVHDITSPILRKTKPKNKETCCSR